MRRRCGASRTRPTRRDLAHRAPTMARPRSSWCAWIAEPCGFPVPRPGRLAVVYGRPLLANDPSPACAACSGRDWSRRLPERGALARRAWYADSPRQALCALRRGQLWCDAFDAEYERERDQLRAQLRQVEVPAANVDLDRAGELLSDSCCLWTHAGVSDARCRDFPQRVDRQMRTRGERTVAFVPCRKYLPLLAAAPHDCEGRGERI